MAPAFGGIYVVDIFPERDWACGVASFEIDLPEALKKEKSIKKQSLPGNDA